MVCSVRGGHEDVCDPLSDDLVKHGHRVDVPHHEGAPAMMQRAEREPEAGDVERRSRGQERAVPAQVQHVA